MTMAVTKTSDFCSGDPSASLRMTGLCAKATHCSAVILPKKTLSSRP